MCCSVRTNLSLEMCKLNFVKMQSRKQLFLQDAGLDSGDF